MKLGGKVVLAALTALVFSVPGTAAPKTKIGILDLQNHFFKYIKTLYDTGSVPVVKTEGWERIHYYKQRNPKGIVCYAMVGGDFDTQKDNPEETARKRWEEYISPTLLKIKPEDKALIDYVEVSPNMKDPKTVEEALWWNRYAEVLCKYVGEAGFHPMIFTIGVGGLPCVSEDDLKVIEALIPSFRAAHKYGGGWSYHGYTCYYTKDLQVESYYSLRYRRVYNFFGKKAPDLMDMPLILSEGGVDYLGDPLRDGYAYRGTREDFASWLEWYDKELKKDPYVAGVTLFKAGGWGWESFDIEPMTPYLVNYYKTGSMKLPAAATKLGIAIPSGAVSDQKVRSAIESGHPILAASPDEVRAAGAVQIYKKANPTGLTVIDFRKQLPDVKAEPNPENAAKKRWDEIKPVVLSWSDEERKAVDFLDITPGPLTIRDSGPARYFSTYMRVLAGLVSDKGFRPIVAAFNTSSVPSDAHDWNVLGDDFRQLWRDAKERGGAVVFCADATVVAKDVNDVRVSKVFGYKSIYQSLLKLDPTMFGMPLVVMIDGMNLPHGSDSDSLKQLKLREDWLSWFDNLISSDPDVLAAVVNPGSADSLSAPAGSSFIEWYTGYRNSRR